MKKPYKDILLTFDYELFLGAQSGTIERCILEPTEKILKIARQYNAKCIFFVDSTFLHQLEVGQSKHPVMGHFRDRIQHQIHRILADGHDVFLHIHPHWLDAIFSPETEQWTFQDISKYRFGSLSNDLKQSVFGTSLEALKSILPDSVSKDIIVGYRAGGFCIDPFSDFAPLFRQHNIIHDFSVLSGSSVSIDTHSYDFRAVDVTALPYRYDESDICKPVATGAFIQFPITGLQINRKSFSNRLTWKLLSKTQYGRYFGDGRGISFPRDRVMDDYARRMEMASVDLLSVNKLAVYLRHLKNYDYMHFVSHPKMVTPHTLDMLKLFLRRVTATYDVNFDFRRMLASPQAC